MRNESGEDRGTAASLAIRWQRLMILLHVVEYIAKPAAIDRLTAFADVEVGGFVLGFRFRPSRSAFGRTIDVQFVKILHGMRNAKRARSVRYGWKADIE
jgi:hypothetical protein